VDEMCHLDTSTFTRVPGLRGFLQADWSAMISRLFLLALLLLEKEKLDNSLDVTESTGRFLSKSSHRSSIMPSRKDALLWWLGLLLS